MLLSSKAVTSVYKGNKKATATTIDIILDPSLYSK